MYHLADCVAFSGYNALYHGSLNSATLRMGVLMTCLDALMSSMSWDAVQTPDPVYWLFSPVGISDSQR